MKFIFSNTNLDLSIASDFSNLETFKINDFHLLINDNQTTINTSERSILTDGYLRDTNFDDILEQKFSAADHVLSNWPVSTNITGTFSSLIFDKVNLEITLATDLTNIYPLYYLLENNKIYISNSIILLGRYSNAELDPAGIFQRAVGPSFMNIGSRTILKNVKRLLPGEWIKLNQKGKILQKKFDNSLYQNIGSPEFRNRSYEEYWDHYKQEVSLCTQEFDHVNIALSGGIDSRIALGAIPEQKEISAYTFGNKRNYESRIAGRLARIKGASHKSYYDPSQYFPKKSILFEYSRNTEAVKLNSWLEILANTHPEKKEPLLLGELCEGLPGRNIKKLNKGEFRKKNFYKYYLQNKSVCLTKATTINFENWKKEKLSFILSWHTHNWFEKLKFSNLKEEIIESTIRDAEEIFQRINAHRLPYAELYDELFSWYTFTRMELSRQVNICNEKFYAYSPGMSLQMLKKTSNLHPNLRLYYRFANKLLKETPELKKFKNIPTSQIPIIPQTWSNIFKIPVWGLRSKMDDWLIKRMMNSKDISKRYRLFKSINWAQIYQQKDMLENIEDYYLNNKLGPKYFEIFYNLARQRKELEKWPFANMDIISGATLNAELTLIKKNMN